MNEATDRTDAFWNDLERQVAAKTDAVLNRSNGARQPVIEYLRDVEGMARRECARRGTIQMIGSARRVLGDTTEVGPAKGPFSRRL